ncbi:4Fe-4S dicluster domain-containing protein [Mycobacterium sp.]|uniref:4Fe-4S dicluster domain-containing protein n=1 Tax=Mycobacterium sp. TaxID=1785 RepID=UPI0025ECD4B8|nr:4Fe-4S dicluster domain-containing protein [Mycobacterium sp.]
MKVIKQVVEIVDENCTGCYRCERICPTGAISMIGPRNKALAAVEDSACIACFRCIDVCNDDAILIAELDESHTVGTNVKDLDPADVNGLCEQAGLDPNQMACLCSSTKVKELAAATLGGADTYEQLALATGAASGCLLYCSVPMRRILEARHGEVQQDKQHLRRYDTDHVLLDIPEDAADRYPLFALRREQAAARERQNEVFGRDR